MLFPPDGNTAVAVLRVAYSTHGQIWTVVVPKGQVPGYLTADQAKELAEVGAVRMRGTGSNEEQILLAAIGSYQLLEILRASDRLSERGLPHSVVCMLEPGRFRDPRDLREAEHVVSLKQRQSLFPKTAPVRVFLTHTRPEPLVGLIRPLDKARPRCGF